MVDNADFHAAKPRKKFSLFKIILLAYFLLWAGGMFEKYIMTTPAERALHRSQQEQGVAYSSIRSTPRQFQLSPYQALRAAAEEACERKYTEYGFEYDHECIAEEMQKMEDH
jgi:hypothetical protein